MSTPTFRTATPADVSRCFQIESRAHAGHGRAVCPPGLYRYVKPPTSDHGGMAWHEMVMDDL